MPHHNVRDITGKRYGRWTVLSYAGKSYWLCRCDCGTEKLVFTGNLKGKTLSCGCFREEHARSAHTTHGLTGTAEYKTWAGVKRRCQNKNDKTYQRYGAKGVTICPGWSDSFEAFLAYMGPQPTPEHTIERIDNARGYEPGNCRWATQFEQAQNKTTSRLVSFQGQTKTVTEWSRITGIGRATIAYRMDHGWTAERALTSAPWPGRNRYSTD